MRIVEKNSRSRLGQRGAGIMVKSCLFYDLELSAYPLAQPRTLELFTTIRIINEVLSLAIPVPLARRYDREGTELEFEMHQVQDPTPSNPFVRRPKHQHRCL